VLYCEILFLPEKALFQRKILKTIGAKTMSEDTYTFDEAIQILGIPRSTFFDKVKRGEIVKIIPEGRQRGAKYLLKEEATGQKTQPEKHVTHAQAVLKDAIFRKAQPEDAQGMYELGERVMRKRGGYGVKPEQLLPYLSIPNSEIGHVLVKENNIIGYFTIVPLLHGQLLKRMRKEAYIVDFPPEELPLFLPDTPMDCFIWEVISEAEERAIGQYLLSKMLKFFHTIGKRGVNIEGVYATATSVEGITLCRRAGMSLMNLPEVIGPRYQPFELKIQENRNWLTIDYILALQAYKRRQDKLKKHAITPLTSSKD